MAATFLLLIITWTTALLSAMGNAAAAAAQGTVNYTIQNNAITYFNEFETQMRPWAEMNMPIISNFIRNTILCGHTKMQTEIILQVQDTLPPPNDRAYASGNTITMSAGFIVNWFKTPAERMPYFRHLMYHEMTHLWQFDEGYTATTSPSKGLVEGIADYATYKGGQNQYVTCRPTKGDLWYDGYCRTAYFLLYLEGHGYAGAVCNLNVMMKNGYDNETFVAILGNRTPEDVWNEYLDNYVDPPPPRLLHGRRPHKNNRTADDHVPAATY